MTPCLQRCQEPLQASGEAETPAHPQSPLPTRVQSRTPCPSGCEARSHLEPGSCRFQVFIIVVIISTFCFLFLFLLIETEIEEEEAVVFHPRDGGLGSSTTPGCSCCVLPPSREAPQTA